MKYDKRENNRLHRAIDSVPLIIWYIKNKLTAKQLRCICHKCSQVFKSSSNKMIWLSAGKSSTCGNFYQISTLIGPHSLHDLVCQRLVSLNCYFLHDLVENSARQKDAEAKNIPKASANHPKYITPGIMLHSTLATGAVSARRGIW